MTKAIMSYRIMSIMKTNRRLMQSKGGKGMSAQ